MIFKKPTNNFSIVGQLKFTLKPWLSGWVGRARQAQLGAGRADWVGPTWRGRWSGQVERAGHGRAWMVLAGQNQERKQKGPTKFPVLDAPRNTRKRYRSNLCVYWFFHGSSCSLTSGLKALRKGANCIATASPVHDQWKQNLRLNPPWLLDYASHKWRDKCYCAWCLDACLINSDVGKLRNPPPLTATSARRRRRYALRSLSCTASA